MTLFKSILFLLISTQASYSYHKFSLDIGIESRAFSPPKSDHLNEYNVTFNTNISLKMKSDYFKAIIDFYAQLDPEDSERNFTIPKDIWLAIDTGKHILKAGFQTVNWSSTEAFHPADIINSRFLDSSLQKPSKIGEPIISYKVLVGESSLTFMYLPYFSDPIFPSPQSSFGPGFEVDQIQIFNTNGSFEDDNLINQSAFRFSTNLAGNDISLSYINHIDRDSPYYTLAGTKNISGVTVPVLDAVMFRKEQIGLTTQSVILGWLLKTETAFINWEKEITSNPLYFRDDYTTVVLGLERSFGTEGGGDFTLILEHQYFYGIDESFLTNTLFQNDFLLGFRFAFNDISSTELFFSVIADIDHQDQLFFNLNFSRRLMESFKLEMGVHLVESKISDNYIGLEIIDNSDHAYFNLRKYF